MAHDVFISYPSQDRAAANRICHALERVGIRCWMAPRDVLPGSDWQDSIMQAIAGSKAFVLVFSGHANNSDHVRREVAAALDARLPVVPFRLEPALPLGALKYNLIDVHWLDAFPPPLDNHVVHLIGTVKRLMQKGPPVPGPAPQTEALWASIPLVRKEWFASLATALAPPVGLFLMWRTIYRREGELAEVVAPRRKAGASILCIVAFLAVMVGAQALVAPPRADPLAVIAARDIPAPARVGGGPTSREFEDVVIPNGPPLTLEGVTILRTGQMREAMKERDEGAVSFALVDARGCHEGMESLPRSECLRPNNVQNLRANHPLQEPLVIFCRDGGCPESYHLAAEALTAGYQRVYWYRGGVNAWKAAGFAADPF